MVAEKAKLTCYDLSRSTQNCSLKRGLYSWICLEPEGDLAGQEDAPKEIPHSRPEIWGWDYCGRPGPGEGC